MGSIGKRSKRYQAQVRRHGSQVISRTHSQKERMHDELQVALTQCFNHAESSKLARSSSHNTDPMQNHT